MILALSLVAGLSAPFVMLPRVQAAAAPLPCAEGNNNGCTELSPTPPEDTVSVPPNIVLMLDDSGSMAWDYMPDWGYLPYSNTNQGARDWTNNSLYYNPNYNFTGDPTTAGYQPPPMADGTPFPVPPACSGYSTALTCAYNEGFTDHGARNITSYTGPSLSGGHSIPYYTAFNTSVSTDVGPAVPTCPSGYTDSGSGGATPCIPNNPNPPTSGKTWQCPNPPGGSLINRQGGYQCRVTAGEGFNYYPAVYQCPSGYTWNGSICVGPVPQPKPYNWVCPSGSSANANHRCIATTTTTIRVFTIDVPNLDRYGNRNGTFTDYYIAGGTDCANLPTANQPRCVNESDTTGHFPDGTVSGPPGVQVGQNVANWFSYYRTRILMAKSSLMTAFTQLSPRYRFGFGSINANGVNYIPGVGSVSGPTPYGFDDSSSGGAGSSSNQLAVVQPFGVGSAGCPKVPGSAVPCNPVSQKDKFWTWLANESANQGTPLRKALQAVGEYYKTSQPWATLSSDPGYTTGSNAQYACRASYAILTTDGFWNGDNPSNIGSAAATDGPVQTVPAGNPTTHYTAQPPFSGGAAAGGVPSLADVATYYWENDLSSMPNEVATSTDDPAAWQHMTTFTVGLGFDPTGISPAGTTIPQIFAWAQGGAAITGFSWPTPSSNSIYNIADLAHAAVNGHGDFFSVKSPQDLANAFSKITSDIGARQGTTPAASVNASVLSLGALSFSTGYNTKDWTGMLEGVTLKTDATVDQVLWLDGKDPNQATMTSQLDAAYHSSSSAAWGARKVYTDSYTVSGSTATFTPFQFNAANKASLDATETGGLQSPALGGGNDTLDNRINYLLGDSTYEGGIYRARTTILGAILRSAPLYVAGATGNYYDNWPSFGGIPAPEAVSGAQTYDDFVTQQSTRAGMVYVGANDGMLHAFYAPVPTCSGSIDANGNCSSYSFAAGANQGQEAWAFVPRAVYANLGNLTDGANFSFLPTVDGTPVTRDVFFSDAKWHTLLVGGVGLGGRGVYALDITNPTAFSASSVKWEFDSDMTSLATGCVSVGNTLAPTCNANDLGFTVSQPNIGRLSNGQWVVLVPNGYFPDCNTPDTPTSNPTQCANIAAQAPKDSSGKPYSALFVLNAETGKMIAELKTPTNISGVTSFGLATPVLGDYNNDQIDDVAFAGDVQGNLWRFDLSSTTASSWTVTLVYKGLADASGNQGVQPITTMPHLFPDPTTNRFMVLFGTGKFLGLGDNSNTVVQALYGVRDDGATHSQADLTQQYLHETQVPTTLPDGTPNSSPLAGASLRCVTGGASDTCDSQDPNNPATPANSVPASSGGWFINLCTVVSGSAPCGAPNAVRNDAGERVVVSPGAIFSSNTVVFETLITGAQSSDPCSPSTQGAIMALSAITGAPAGVSSLGGWPIVGGRITNARTSGSLPIVSSLGGGQAYLPGTALAPGKNPLSIDAPIWRRRSWQGIQQN
ncbi:MAG: pilus assembly protein [Rhodanobacteraceae bacterium]